MPGLKYRAFTLLKDLVGSNPYLFRRSRLVMRAQRVPHYVDWKALLGPALPRWEAERARADGPNVLIASADGGNLQGTTLETLLGVAMTLRGAKVHYLLCDGVLPACWECDSTFFPNMKRFVQKGPQADLCKTCYAPGAKAIAALGFTVHRLGDHIQAHDRSDARAALARLRTPEIAAYRYEGLAVGEHAVAGALRFFARGEIGDEPHSREVLERYFEAAYVSAAAMLRLLRSIRFSSLVCTHGIYVPFGLINEAARKEKVPLSNWNVAYRKKCFVFSHGDTYHHTLMNEPVSAWEGLEWTPELDARIMDYLKQRMQGSSQDWIWFHDRPQFDMEAIGREIGLDPGKPVIGMLTNVIWDAQLHYPANAFPNMIDWAMRTIEWFAARPDLQLLIRVHPAEIRGFLKSRQLMVDEIRKRFPVLPGNVFVVGPESQYSTYALMGASNAVIIYGTKTGVELTSMGIPVIVAGEAWIRNKGLTLDAPTAEEYFRILGTLPLPARMDEAAVRRARMYAYHFFFRRMIPLGMLEVQDNKAVPFRIRLDRGLDGLRPGADPGLDTLCDGILKGTPFIYRDELHHAAPAAPAAPASAAAP